MLFPLEDLLSLPLRRLLSLILRYLISSPLRFFISLASYFINLTMPNDFPSSLDTTPPVLEKPSDWTAIAAAKRAARDALIPEAWRLPDKPEYTDESSPAYLLDVTGVPASCGILTPDELIITDTPADKILRNVHSGKWTARAVAEAFCKRAAVAQQLVSHWWGIVDLSVVRRGKGRLMSERRSTA